MRLAQPDEGLAGLDVELRGVLVAGGDRQDLDDGVDDRAVAAAAAELEQGGFDRLTQGGGPQLGPRQVVAQGDREAFVL